MKSSGGATHGEEAMKVVEGVKGEIMIMSRCDESEILAGMGEHCIMKLSLTSQLICDLFALQGVVRVSGSLATFT